MAGDGNDPGIVAKGARVISVFGPFNSRALIDVPSTLAAEMFGDEALEKHGLTNVVDAVERDLEKIRAASVELADSAAAATAIRLAYELDNPYNSATSKSMCAKTLIDALDGLRELMPEARKEDGVNDLAAKRAARRAGAATATG